jgi:hypothetical protein
MTQQGSRTVQFTTEQFTATPWASAADKARFANHFVRFVERDFRWTLFYDWFYRRLHTNLFGHIAHFNRGGFYATWFASPARQAEFLEHAVAAHAAGDPEHTWSDVAQALQKWIGDTGALDRARTAAAAALEAAERAELARLKAKYEGSSPEAA